MDLGGLQREGRSRGPPAQGNRDGEGLCAGGGAGSGMRKGCGLAD